MIVDFQKIAATIHEFQVKLDEDMECAGLRDALNFALLQLQRYFRMFRMLRSRTQQQQQQQHGESIQTLPLHGLSPVKPYRDSADQFVWRWVDVDTNNGDVTARTSATLPARLDRDSVSLPAMIQAARNSDNGLLVQLIERGNLHVAYVITRFYPLKHIAVL